MSSPSVPKPTPISDTVVTPALDPTQRIVDTERDPHQAFDSLERLCHAAETLPRILQSP